MGRWTGLAVAVAVLGLHGPASADDVQVNGTLRDGGDHKVLHVWGTHIEMGYAHGYLLADEVMALAEGYILPMYGVSPDQYETLLSVVLPTFEEHKRLLDTGVNLQFDHFGREVSYSDVAPAQELPNDAQRIGYINRLVDEGYARQILMSHDTPTKDRLTVWGGPGYGHILHSIVPRMKIKGIADEHIRAILVENPARILQFAEPG